MVCYRDIPFCEVALIKEAWERNRAFHEEISQFFGDLYAELVFEDRIQGFAVFDADMIKITVAQASDTGAVVGFCISTLEGVIGEPHTLYVRDEVRRMGIGRELMHRHLAWLKDRECKMISITLACENRGTQAFYETFGFRPNLLHMRLI